MSQEPKGRYAARGVSASKTDVHKAVDHLDRGLYPKAFCKITPDHFTGLDDRCTVIHSDGSGTKSILAYLWYKETGDASVFEGIAQDSIVMNLDDLLCVGVRGGLLLSSTINRNAKVCGADVIAAIIGGNEKFIQTMREYGMDVINGGGETADMGDSVRTITVDTCAVASMPKSEVIAGGIVPVFHRRSVLLGKSELRDQLQQRRRQQWPHQRSPRPAGPPLPRHLPRGLGSRGRPLPGLLRPLPPERCLAGLQPQSRRSPFEPHEELRAHHLEDARRLPRGRQRTHPLHRWSTNQVSALWRGRALCQRRALRHASLFSEIQKHSGTSLQEMYQVYNMGHRMEVYCPPEKAQKLIDISKSFGVDAKVRSSARR